MGPMGPQIVPVWQHRDASCRYGNTGTGRDGMATQPHGPHGPQVRLLLWGAISKSLQKLAFSHFWGPKWVKTKIEIEGVGPPSQNRAAILHLGAVSMSQMVARRPIWWQKGWLWGPLGFRAQPAHPWALGPGPRSGPFGPKCVSREVDPIFGTGGRGRWLLSATDPPMQRTNYPNLPHTPDDPKGSADFFGAGWLVFAEQVG